jgi:formiminotetrahydrofolate cyclodeaminase
MPKKLKTGIERWKIIDRDIPKIKTIKERVIQNLVSGLIAEDKFKNWWIEQALKNLDINIEELKDQLEELEYELEETEVPEF